MADLVTPNEFVDGTDIVAAEANENFSDHADYINASIANSLAKAGTAGQIVVCNASGVPQYRTPSGDVAVSSDGALTISNLAGSKLADGGVTGAKIADDVIGVYRTILSQTQVLASMSSGDIFPLRPGGTSGALNFSTGTVGSYIPLLAIDSDDFAISGRTAKLRLRGQFLAGDSIASKFPNATAIKLALREVESVSNTTATVADSVVSGSEISFGLPGNGSISNEATADFDLPDDGIYTLCAELAATGGVTVASGCEFQMSGQLQVRHV